MADANGIARSVKAATGDGSNWIDMLVAEFLAAHRNSGRIHLTGRCNVVEKKLVAKTH
ncbi:hypothetical protein AAKU55_003508 [Oxalobacteraceae bacterium GrIS 1.11]